MSPSKGFFKQAKFTTTCSCWEINLLPKPTSNGTTKQQMIHNMSKAASTNIGHLLNVFYYWISSIKFLYRSTKMLKGFPFWLAHLIRFYKSEKYRRLLCAGSPIVLVLVYISFSHISSPKMEDITSYNLLPTSSRLYDTFSEEI